MGQAASCFGQGKQVDASVDVLCPQSKAAQQNFAAETNNSKPAEVKQSAQDQQSSSSAAEQGKPAGQKDETSLDPSLACCLGVAPQPGSKYDVTVSGPPLPGCEQDRLSVLGELLNEFAPRDELHNILSLVCNMFSVQNALVSLFFDRRVYIIDGTGVFSEGDFPWRYSMCGWTMTSERHCVMIVNDVSQDARFCHSPVAKQYGVRFYVGAPLVSSTGHRLGTLCFADSQPRVFDDASLKLLCNFSELVTRALERDLVVAHHQQMTKPGEALKELDQKHRYRMMLRNIDCVNSAVLLVDTGTPGWTVHYANSGWHSLLQHHAQSQATNEWVAASGTAGAEAKQSRPPSAAAAAGSGAALAAANGQANGGDSGMDRMVPSNITGLLLFPAIEQQLRQEPDGGSGTLQQLQQLLASRQPFSLHGVKMPAFSYTTLTLVFRSAGVSEIEGSVSVCVPSWVPQSAAVAKAAAALQAGAADKVAPNTTCAPWQTLYFVTVTVESAQEKALRTKLPGTQASSVGSFSVGQDRQSQGTNVITLSVPSSSRSSQEGGSSRGSYDGSSCMVLSHVSSQSSLLPPPSTSNDTTDSNSAANNISSDANASLLSGGLSGSVSSITRASAAAAARAVCRKIEGLQVGGLIASGSYGRVYRASYYGSTVAVKVLESDCVLRREAATGLCLEALLGEKLRHPNIISTLAWAVVTGKSKMAVGKRLWGESLDADKPSIAQNKAAINSAAQQQQQQQASTASSASSAAVRNSLDVCDSVSQQMPMPSEAGDSSSSLSSSLSTAETWLVLEFCGKGCLQDAIDRGWLRDGPGGDVSLIKVVVTAAEIAAGMFTLHKADVTHGDLSPYNVLLNGSEPAGSDGGRGFVAKISDFGLSRPMGGQSKVLTKTYGTITHMAPELLEHGITSKAADVYSFGVLLWQMLASSRAWAGLSHHAVVHTVCVKQQQLQFPADAPEALVDLGQACMAWAAADRPTFKDVLEVLTPLREFVEQAMAEQ